MLEENKKNRPGSSIAKDDVPARFHNTGSQGTFDNFRNPLLWIRGFEIISVFHMKQHHLERWGVEPYALGSREIGMSSNFRMRRYYLR
jgi:hypothetical protein